MNGSSHPEHIAISRSKGIRIDWKDDHTSEYSLSYLRDRCPCATCTGAHGTPPRQAQAATPFPMYQPALKLVSAEPVGNYALRITWSDGHNTGIYSWEHLRALCPCVECRSPDEAGQVSGARGPG